MSSRAPGEKASEADTPDSATQTGDATSHPDSATQTGDATSHPDNEPRVLVVDNFDSFTYNLVEYLSEHARTEVVRNTASLSDVRGYDPDAIVVSPGPGHPRNERDVGVSTPVLQEVSPEVPTLGVCLGLEVAVYAYGGTVGRAPDPVHGKAVPIDHDGAGLYAGLNQKFEGGRYHSLVATDVPASFEVTATTDIGEEELVMGIRHRDHPITAVQFHPESVLTSVGHDVVQNFLTMVDSWPDIST